MLSVEDARAALGVPRATVWRMIQRKELASVRQRGRRLIPEASLRSALRPPRLIPMSPHDPMARFIGIAHSGGKGPGASDKHAILEEALMARRVPEHLVKPSESPC